MTPETATVVAAAIGAVATIGAAFAGKSWGSRGKKAGLESTSAEIDLNGTTWVGDYQDTDADGNVQSYSGSIEFRQFGSRVTGEGRSNGRKWLLEGVISNRKVCYVYVGQGGNSVSIGTSNLELDGSGDNLIGQWAGWAPDGTKLEPQQLRLHKQR